MYHALVYFPNIKQENFHDFRNRYDPYVSLIKEHLSIIFPIPGSVDKDEFIQHIEKVLFNWHAFDITISGFFKTFDQWLMLAVKDGHDQVIALHDDLYADILRPFKRDDLPFTPHVGLGYFGKKTYDFHHPTAAIPLDSRKYTQALAAISEEDLTFQRTVDSLTMLELDDSFTSCREIMSFNI